MNCEQNQSAHFSSFADGTSSRSVAPRRARDTQDICVGRRAKGAQIPGAILLAQLSFVCCRLIFLSPWYVICFMTPSGTEDFEVAPGFCEIVHTPAIVCMSLSRTFVRNISRCDTYSAR